MPPFDDYTNQIPFGVAWLKARHLLTSVLQSDIGNFFSSRMTFLLWIVTGHVTSRTCLGYAKTADV